MPKYSKEHEKEFIAKIRQVLVYNPNAPILAVQKSLSMNGINLNKDYINKLLRKIRGERAKRYQNTAVKEAVAQFEDFVRLMNQELLKIVKNPDDQHVKIKAINQLVKQYENLLKMQLDVSVFDKPSDNRDFSIVHF